MSGVGQKERATQNRVIELFKSKLKYTYIGNLHDRENSNIEKAKLNKYLQRQGYSAELIRRAMNALLEAAQRPDLYQANKEVYSLLRYGASVKEDVSVHQMLTRWRYMN
ncbi:MAG: hypothetical protein ACOX6X_05905 [Dethiobacteria bacterium]|jgi:type I restriction enzyme R subunit